MKPEERSEKLKALKEESRKLFDRIHEIDKETRNLEHQDEIDKAKECLGKFYQKKDSGLGETILFHPKGYTVPEYSVYVQVLGVSAEGHLFKIGDRTALIMSSHGIDIPELLKDYEEIDEETWKELFADIVDIV
jgi:hypothetical protein